MFRWLGRLLFGRRAENPAHDAMRRTEARGAPARRHPHDSRGWGPGWWFLVGAFWGGLWGSVFGAHAHEHGHDHDEARRRDDDAGGAPILDDQNWRRAGPGPHWDDAQPGGGAIGDGGGPIDDGSDGGGGDGGGGGGDGGGE